MRSALISVDCPRVRDQRAPGRRLNFKFENRREANGAQHSQSVFREALRWITDGANQPRLEISAAADKVDHFLRDGIEKHSVDGEVAALGIFLW